MSRAATCSRRLAKNWWMLLLAGCPWWTDKEWCFHHPRMALLEAPYLIMHHGLGARDPDDAGKRIRRIEVVEPGDELMDQSDAEGRDDGQRWCLHAYAATQLLPGR